MIVVVEPHMTGGTHAPFNAALLEALSLAFPGEPTRFCASDSHVAATLDLAASLLRPRFEVATLPEAPATRTRWSRISRMIRLCDFVRSSLPKGKGHLLVWTSTSTELLIALKLVALSTGRSANDWLFHHSVLNGVTRFASPWRLACSPLWWALRTTGGSRYVHWVLEPTIARYVATRARLPADAFAVFPHPVQDNCTVTPGRADTGIAVRFGFLGQITAEKGYDVFLRAAAEATSDGSGGPEFVVAGHTRAEEFHSHEHVRFLHLPPRRERLPRAEYDSIVLGLKYVCLPLQGGRYDASASGTLLDAVAFRKPVIALRTAITESFFTTFGDIGYLCDSEEDFLDTVAKVSRDTDAHRYARQVSNLDACARTRTPRALASLLTAARAPSASDPGPSGA